MTIQLPESELEDSLAKRLPAALTLVRTACQQQKDTATMRRNFLNTLLTMIRAEEWFLTAAGKSYTPAPPLQGGFFHCRLPAQAVRTLVVGTKMRGPRFGNHSNSPDSHNGAWHLESEHAEALVPILAAVSDQPDSGLREFVLLVRSSQAPDFSGTDLVLGRALTREMFQISPPCLPPRFEVRLSPRLQQIATLLLLGHSRKHIAESTGLSVHTVDGYIKSIYADHGVCSQVEFMARHSELRTRKPAPYPPVSGDRQNLAGSVQVKKI